MRAKLSPFLKYKSWLYQSAFLIALATMVVSIEKGNAQLFIPMSNWGCKTVSDSVTVNNSTDFSLGTFSNTTLSGNTVTLSVGQASGTYTSKVFDLFGGCPPISLWSGFDWQTPNPYGKEIPTTNETAVDYPSVTAGLNTSLLIYNRLNGSGNIASGVSLTSTVGVNAAARNANGTGLAYVSGAIRTGVSLDGTDDFLEFPYTQTNVNAYSIATWFRTSTAGNGVFAQNRGGGPGRSLTLGIGNNPGGCAAGRISYGLDSDSIYIGKCTTNTYNNGQWRHVVGVWSGVSGTAVAAGQFTIYVDGQSVAQTNTSIGSLNAPLTGLLNTKLGRHDAWGVNYNGSLDEFLIWNRALTPTEVQQLFQRGGNNIRYQIKTCDSPDCSDVATWKGPSNTTTSYFSELNNTTIPDSDGSGTVLSTYPSVTYTDFPSLVVDYKRFFQYQATLTTSNTTIIPALNSTTVRTACAAGTANFTAAGNFTLPSNCTQMTVTVNGAGGATGRRTGSGTRANSGRGGQAVKILTSQTPGSIYAVSVGTGGVCAQTAGTGAYDGGDGGTTNAAGSPGAGAAGAGGTAGTGGGSGFSGGTGNYGAGGGGGGGAANTGGGGGGAASSISFSGVELIIAGGGGGSGGTANGTAGTGGTGCSGAASGDFTRGGNGGNAPGSASGGGGGGGRCYCTGGCNSASALGGLAGDTAGTSCQTSNDGANGSVTIDYQ